MRIVAVAYCPLGYSCPWMPRCTGSDDRMCRSETMTVASRPSVSAPVLRRPDLDPNEIADVVWNRDAAEFVAAANSVSLLMPSIEPYFAGSIRRSLPRLEPSQVDEARTFIRQELEHQRQHRRFNRLLTERFSGLRRPEERARRLFAWMSRTRSLEFGLAYAAASETIAYSLARWTSDHLAEFMRGADPAATDLFIWHLAEEVEHKSVAFDVWTHVDGSRWRYAWAAVVSMAVLAWLGLWSILVMLHVEKLLHRHGTWWRLGRLLMSFVFEVVPNLAMSALPGHHPDQLTDPDWYAAWLVDMEIRHGIRRVDAASGT